jgi:hypothetical protein
MADDTIDLYSLSERIKRVHGDVRELRTESATRADLCRLRGEVVGIRADIMRIELRLDAFAERLDDRFDQLIEWLKSETLRLASQVVPEESR